ncbi:MAG: class I SAM-dependent methyltransferase [Acutalibacter sp.]|nr:class I SAM-dependent methyltransferase [Acutalibacter sp.]
MSTIDKVRAFYQQGGEENRLEQGLGVVEGFRTKELISRYLRPAMDIYDIGGGAGYYADWLAAGGHRVTMIELVPAAVEKAKACQSAPYTAMTGDARSLPFPDTSADACLLLGPLYHLQEKEDRMQALREALRVLRPGGLLFAAGISKYSSMTWALSVYGLKNDYIDDPVYREMLRKELLTGRHCKPAQYSCLCDAYFHTPEGFQEELAEAGFSVNALYAVEGCAWLAPSLSEKWKNPACLENLLSLVRMTEQEPSLLGISPHFLAVAKAGN